MTPITITIETPRHTAGKYVFDPVHRYYKLKKILPLGMYFPYDFGMIENTRAEDGDPVDVMVVTECITYPGMRILCRIVGSLQVRQNKNNRSIRNDRYLAVSVDSIMFEHIKEITDFSRKHNQQLKNFFINYAEAENNRLISIKFIKATNAKINLNKLIK